MGKEVAGWDLYALWLISAEMKRRGTWGRRYPGCPWKCGNWRWCSAGGKDCEGKAAWSRLSIWIAINTEKSGCKKHWGSSFYTRTCDTSWDSDSWERYPKPGQNPVFGLALGAPTLSQEGLIWCPGSKNICYFDVFAQGQSSEWFYLCVCLVCRLLSELSTQA